MSSSRAWKVDDPVFLENACAAMSPANSARIPQFSGQMDGNAPRTSPWLKESRECFRFPLCVMGQHLDGMISVISSDNEQTFRRNKCFLS